MSECKHGSLARACEICERDAEIESLRAELAEKDKRIEELEEEYNTVVNKLYARGHRITDAQIDAAWEYTKTINNEGMGATRALRKLNIVACEECVGSGIKDAPRGHVTGQCPACYGHGWVTK